MHCSVYIAGLGAAIPPAIPVQTAIAEGRYDRARATRGRQLAAAVAPHDQPPVQLALEASVQACKHAGADPRDIGLVLYCSVYDTGFELWNPPSYLQRELGIPAGPCEVAEVRSGCDAALVALRMARLHLQADGSEPYALVAAAECWREPSIDRWLTDSQTVLGDAGTAMVLSRDGGFLRIVAVCSQTDPALEGLSHGDEPFMSPRGGQYPIDLGRRATAFSRSMPWSEITHRIREGVHTVVHRAISQAGIELHDIKHVVMPFLGWHSLKPFFFDDLGFDVDISTFEYSRRIGHTGASDPIAGLEHLANSGRLTPGDWTLIVATGYGFIWTAIVLQGV